MIPKRKRRTIVVDNVTYEYAVVGHVSVFIHNPVTGIRLHWWQEWKPKWKQAITPQVVEEIIRTGEHAGTKARQEGMLK